MNERRPATLGSGQLNAFLADHFPRAEKLFEVESVTDEGLVLTCYPDETHLRPGGTVSGPLLMTMADTAMYLAVLSRLGLEPMTVTTNLNINFLRRAEAGPLTGRVRLLKFGSRLAVGDVTITAEADASTVAHASLTYSIPPSPSDLRLDSPSKLMFD